MLRQRLALLGFLALASLLFGLGGPHSASGIPTPTGNVATVIHPIRTFQFTARIDTDGGVTPFRAGQVITGSFSYDLEARDEQAAHAEYGCYVSPRNTFFFQLGNQRFSLAGRIRVTTGTWKAAEHFGIVANDIQVPDGWDVYFKGKAQYFGFFLQNAPSKGVLPNKALPKRLVLSNFVNTRELRLVFFQGLRFPGGQTMDRVTVSATVESLKEVAN